MNPKTCLVPIERIHPLAHASRQGELTVDSPYPSLPGPSPTPDPPLPPDPSPFPGPPLPEPAPMPNPPQPPDPSHAWQQFVTMWTEFWTKALTLSPDTIQTSQKLWMDQLETISQGFAKVMGTDSFAAMQGKFFEQQLSWQDHLTKTIQPQTDAALRALNLPSRNQMDRLFERIVHIEERLDDLETDTRLIRRALRHGNDAAPAES